MDWVKWFWPQFRILWFRPSQRVGPAAIAILMQFCPSQGGFRPAFGSLVRKGPITLQSNDESSHSFNGGE